MMTWPEQRLVLGCYVVMSNMTNALNFEIKWSIERHLSEISKLSIVPGFIRQAAGIKLLQTYAVLRQINVF